MFISYETIRHYTFSNRVFAGHTQSWEKGQPGLLTQCYDPWGEHPLPNTYGPMDPTKASVFEFLAELYGEIAEVFPDKMVHIGGDEVNLKCWKTNPRILEVMDLWNITGDFRQLESHFIESVLNIVDNLPGDKQSIGMNINYKKSATFPN